jgi:hypothetical protein
MELTNAEKQTLTDWCSGKFGNDEINQVALLDGEYSNELLLKICCESPTFARLVRSSLHYLDTSGDNHLPTWLGSFMEDRPKTQVQLVITQAPQFTIDED